VEKTQMRFLKYQTPIDISKIQLHLKTKKAVSHNPTQSKYLNHAANNKGAPQTAKIQSEYTANVQFRILTQGTKCCSEKATIHYVVIIFCRSFTQSKSSTTISETL